MSYNLSSGGQCTLLRPLVSSGRAVPGVESVVSGAELEGSLLRALDVVGVATIVSPSQASALPRIEVGSASGSEEGMNSGSGCDEGAASRLAVAGAKLSARLSTAALWGEVGAFGEAAAGESYSPASTGSDGASCSVGGSCGVRAGCEVEAGFLASTEVSR